MPDEKKPAPDKQSYFLVFLNDDVDGVPRCVTCKTEEDFVEAVEQNVLSAQKAVFAFAFKGERIPIGAPKPVCVLTIGGETRQIGKATTEYDESGRIIPLVVPGPPLPSDA